MEGRLQAVNPAVDIPVEYAVWEVAKEIANICEAGVSWRDEGEISSELNDAEPVYRYAAIGEILQSDGSDGKTLFEAPATGKLVNVLPTSDNLTRMINQRLGEQSYGN